MVNILENTLKSKKQRLLRFLYECDFTLEEINGLESKEFYYNNFFGDLIEKLEKDLENQYDIV